MTVFSAIFATLPALELLGCVIGATLVTEIMLWAWAYRHNSFKNLKVQLERQGKRAKTGSQLDGKKTKKADRAESQLKEQVTKALASLRLKQAVVMGGSLFVLFRLLASRYDGMLMAKLPFEPPALLRKLSQRGLTDAKADDCAFAFLYAVLNVGIRPNVGKLLDLGPSRKMLDMASVMPKQQ